tara:strand:+ start:352 stop:1254 length:903 start_codon:yes stop_codon:yes gene_type:complete
MKKIKIGYFADGKWSHKAFYKLIEDDSLEIKFIVPRNDTNDNILKKLAKEYKIDYLPEVSINSNEFLFAVRNYNCDLFISMSFNQIFKNTLINIPRLKTINCHAGKLPFYRGRNILNWVLINDEKEFGITVHYIDEGIDTGDIIIQELFPIDDNDDYSTLLDKAYLGCSELLYKAVKKIQKGNFKRISQNDIHPHGFYCGKRIKGDEILNWNQSSRNVFNFIRAISYPGPVARSFIKGVEMKINKARMIKDSISYNSTIGQIVGKYNQNLIVKTKDTIIEIIDYEYNGKLKIGDRFTNEK